MSNNLIRSGNLDMLRSMYDFKATYARSLSFKANEYFILYQTITKHKNWWEVINEKGEVGFVPSNYVETVTVSPAFCLQHIENCIEFIKHYDENATDYSVGSKKELLLRLKEMKSQAENLPDAYQNSIGVDEPTVLPPLLFRNSEGQLETTRGTIHNTNANSSTYSSTISELKKFKEVQEPVKNVQIKATSRENSKSSIEEPHEDLKNQFEFGVKKSEVNVVLTNSKISPITSQSVYELVECVRINTHLSHDMSKTAVQTVIQGLHDLLPASAFPYLSTILSHCQTSLAADDLQIDQTHDASRLRIIFNELTSCKEDSQQRSWMLHEDEVVIKEYISELISILSNADANISIHVVSNNHYHVITTLIQYYQMEVRWSIRQLLLQAFGVLCSLDRTIVSIMLNSVLPSELARDMMSHVRNVPRLNYSSLLLTMIFSMGEPMPVTHLDYLGIPFLVFILNNIESPPDTDVDEQIPDLFLNLILSYNLQFALDTDNMVLLALAGRRAAKIFTEKILLLLNREDDPVRIFDHEPAPPHSLIKLFDDLFSMISTADLFYTNDVKVLIDIIVRNILDLSPGDKKRNQYLQLCRKVMRNTNYGEHCHRREDMLKCFTRILCEESAQTVQDQKLVREIMNEFPQHFK